MRFRALDIGHAPDGVAPGDLLAALAEPATVALADALPDGLIALDTAGVVVLANRAAESIHGLKRDELLGSTLAELAEASALDCVELADAFHNNRRDDLYATTSDGRAILISLRPVRDRRRDTVFTQVVMRDLDVIDHQRNAGAPKPGLERFRFRADRAKESALHAHLALTPELESVIAYGERALRRRARILLTGESGSGKTEIAKHLHGLVCGDSRPFIHVNCGSIPESLFESEMFGYERGSFTGALQGGKKGLIENAGGGTLFLDEVGEIPLISQAKLLKFLEDGTVQRIGAAAGKRVDVRVIAATNRDLDLMVEEGRFRRDLYFRLNVIALDVPPLRGRGDLIAALIDLFLARANERRTPPLALSEACRARLLEHDYPGNVRELANIVEHLSVVADGEAGPEDLPPSLMAHVGADFVRPARAGAAPSGFPHISLKDEVRAYETELIGEAIRILGSKRKAAQALGVDIGTVVRKTRGGGRR
jgi:PAS domain S-box-containing protein